LGRIGGSWQRCAVTDPRHDEPAVRSKLEAACLWLAAAVPLLVSLWRASPSSQWRDDLAVVRGLGFVPVGAEGIPSSLLCQLAALLPVTGRLMRAAFVSGAGVALASVLIYVFARRALDADGRMGRLASPLSLGAALLASLSAGWQLEGSVAGGATWAVSFALAGLLVAAGPSGDARRPAGLGALLAAAMLESHAAGAALAVGLLAHGLVAGRMPSRQAVALFVGGFLGLAALGLVPVVARPLSERAWIDLGIELSSAGITGLDAPAERPGAVAVWLNDLGVVAMALAVGGLLVGLVTPRLRKIAAPLAAWVALDLVFPAPTASLLATDALTPLRLLCVAALAIAAALGVGSAALALSRSRLPLGRKAAVLLVVFHFTLVLVSSDDAAYVAERRAQSVAERWTDAALGGLPHRSLLLVRSPAIAWRLWAARVVRGERPDLIVVPLALLDHGSVAARLLETDSALAPLIREMAISGRPSEYALSSLADSRPVYLELDPSWDYRLIEHLLPRPFWLRFSPHALGRSDRSASLGKSRRAFRRVLDAATRPPQRDAATLAVLSARASEQAVALAALGDREGLAGILEDLRRIDPAHSVAAEVSARLERREKGRIDVAGLLP
jgi:hypothetical protein